MVKRKIVQNIFTFHRQSNNHLWDDEHQSFVPAAQTFYLEVTL